MLRITLLVITLISCVLSDKVAFKDCGSVSGKITSLDVTPCPKEPCQLKRGSVSGKITSLDVTPCPKEPCQLKRGTTVNATINFTTLVDSTVAKTVVHGIINNIPVPYPLPQGKVTPDLPLKQNSNVVYTNGIPVQKSYPKLSLIVKWELQDDNGKDLFCFVLPAQIID